RGIPEDAPSLCHLRLTPTTYDSHNSRLLRLVHILEPAHHGGVGEGRRVPQGAAFRDVLEQPTHDLSAASLGKVGGKEDLVGPRDGADLVGHVRLELALELG